jgi:hypothetical protein
MTEDPIPQAELAEQLEARIVREYGMVLVGHSLMRVLGYPSLGALRTAIYRGTVPIPVFPLPNRRGKGALASAAAKWLAEQHLTAAQTKIENE